MLPSILQCPLRTTQRATLRSERQLDISEKCTAEALGDQGLEAAAAAAGMLGLTGEIEEMVPAEEAGVAAINMEGEAEEEATGAEMESAETGQR